MDDNIEYLNRERFKIEPPPSKPRGARKFKGPKVEGFTNLETSQAFNLIQRYPGVTEQATTLGATVAETAPAFALGAAASVMKDFYNGNAARIREEQADLMPPIDESEIDLKEIAAHLEY